MSYRINTLDDGRRVCEDDDGLAYGPIFEDTEQLEVFERFVGPKILRLWNNDIDVAKWETFRAAWEKHRDLLTADIEDEDNVQERIECDIDDSAHIVGKIVDNSVRDGNSLSIVDEREIDWTCKDKYPVVMDHEPQPFGREVECDCGNVTYGAVPTEVEKVLDRWKAVYVVEV